MGATRYEEILAAAIDLFYRKGYAETSLQDIAAASGLGRRISESISAGALNEVSVQADDAALYIYSAGSKAVLAVLSPQGGNAGLIHLEARAAAKEIGDLF